MIECVLVIGILCQKKSKTLCLLVHSDIWDSHDVLAVYAGRDELVARADTEEFLRLNPHIQRLCIEETSHRMLRPEHLAQALDRAAEHLV